MNAFSKRIVFCISVFFQFYERDLTRLGMPAPASAEEVSKFFSLIIMMIRNRIEILNNLIHVSKAADADEKLKSSEVSENENKDPLEAPVTPLPRVGCIHISTPVIIFISNA